MSKCKWLYEDLGVCCNGASPFCADDCPGTCRFEEMEIRVSLDEGAFPPERAHEEDAGIDLKSPVTVTVPAGGFAVIDTGVHVEIPIGYAGFLKSKSGLNVKHSITSDGVIDAGYTGAIVCKLYNHGTEDYTVQAGDKMTQLVILPIRTGPIAIVPEISGGDRGAGGFGSTGR